DGAGPGHLVTFLQPVGPGAARARAGVGRLRHRVVGLSSVAAGDRGGRASDDAGVGTVAAARGGREGIDGAGSAVLHGERGAVVARTSGAKRGAGGVNATVDLLVFSALTARPWWQALLRVQRLTRGEEGAAGRPDPDELARAYDALVRALIAAGVPDVPTAIARDIATIPAPVGSQARAGLPPGLRSSLRRDLEVLSRLARTDFVARAEA